MIAALLFASGMLVLGAVAWRLRSAREDERARAEALHQALEARLWEERALEIDAPPATVQDLRRRTHEANNALSTALLSAQYLLDQTRAERFSDETRAGLISAAEGMVEALERLRSQLDRAPRPATTRRPPSALIEPAPLWPALEACAQGARAHNGQVAIELGPPEAELRRARVAVCGGRTGLERALGRVLAQAVALARSKVVLRASAELGVDLVAIEVQDDGPGFPPEALEKRIEPFESVRPGATGLGLYTAERIVRASHGSLRRDNPEGGGARVSLYLPLAAEPAAR